MYDIFIQLFIISFLPTASHEDVSFWNTCILWCYIESIPLSSLYSTSSYPATLQHAESSNNNICNCESNNTIWSIRAQEEEWRIYHSKKQCCLGLQMMRVFWFQRSFLMYLHSCRFVSLFFRKLIINLNMNIYVIHWANTKYKTIIRTLQNVISFNFFIEALYIIMHTLIFIQ